MHRLPNGLLSSGIVMLEGHLGGGGDEENAAIQPTD